MKHKNYYEIIAKDNYDLGLKTGKLFAKKNWIDYSLEFL